MNYLLALFFVYTPISISAFAANPTEITQNVNKNGAIIDGYDVVSYFTGTHPTKGSEKFRVEQNGVSFLFVNEQNKQAFLKEPKKYEPQFGGWCAYAVAEKKEKVEVDPENYLIQDGRLLLFYDSFFAHTKKSWEDQKGIGKEAYLKKADKNWPEVMKQRKP